MAGELISAKEGKLNFGNHTLPEKSKLEGFECGGNIYKVKTFKELTKLERDGINVYESEPGTTVSDFVQTADGLTFTVQGEEDAMITLGLKEETEYDVIKNGTDIGKMKSNLGGKLSISVSLSENDKVEVKVIEA